jgi:glycosyltransferase involved in cell wall biosynthesis
MNAGSITNTGSVPPPANPRTILYIDHTAELGGGEIALFNLVTHLDVRRYRPVVMLFAEGPLAVRLRAASVEVLVVPLSAAVMNTRKDSLNAGSLFKVRQASASLGHAARVAKIIRKLRPAIVHTNSLKADIIGGFAAKLARVPLVWHVRDRIAEDYLPRRVAQSFRWLARRLPTHVIANSSATLNTLADDVTRGTEHFSVIHNGTVIHDGIAICEAVAPVARIGACTIGLIGRISPWKGQDVLIRAAAKLRASGVDCHYRLIGSALFGEADYEAGLRRLADELGVSDIVEFSGFRSDVAAEVAKLHIVVHASTVPEPFGQVIIEGMVASKPVIASRAGGVIEIVDEERTGLLTPPGDVDALAAAILRLVEDPNLARRLGEAAREAVIARFSIGRVAADVARLYDNLLNGVPG